MESRTEHHERDLLDTSQYGEYLNEPSNQLVRLISLFQPKQRVKFLKDTHSDFVAPSSRSTLKQFVGSQVLEQFLDGLEDSLVDRNPSGQLYTEAEVEVMRDVLDCCYEEGIQSISLGKLVPEVRQEIASTVTGEDSLGVARILARTLLATDMTRNEELTRLLARTVRGNVLTAEQAAALASAVEYNNQDVARFEGDAEYLVDETPLIPAECFDSEADRLRLTDHAGSLRITIEEGRAYREAALEQQHELAAIDELCENYRLAPGPTGLFVPLRQHLLVARSIAEAEKLAHDSRDLLLAMSPREFEEFMANIFGDLGFDVELTKTTRDGGVDLICMRSLLGVPIRIAVELKRYRDRPIDVRLIRSFVGSNLQHKADRLLYVTTSRYTAPARDYADRFAAHLLTLKEYDQIAEWCTEVQRSRVPLL